jgi:hypothetical protein
MADHVVGFAGKSSFGEPEQRKTHLWQLHVKLFRRKLSLA